MKSPIQNIENENNSIKLRSQRIVQFIQAQRKQICDNLKKQFQNCANKWERTCSDVNKVQYCYEGLANFVRATVNVIDVYFPVLSSELMITLQTQESLQSRINQFKASIFKSLKSTATKLWLHYDVSHQPQNMQQKQSKRKIRLRKKLKNKTKKGSNSKIPASKSSFLTQWLLLNFKNPYPSNEQKTQLAKKSNLHQKQVNNWFINVRQRDIKKYIKNDSKSQQLKQTVSRKRKNQYKIEQCQ